MCVCGFAFSSYAGVTWLTSLSHSETAESVTWVDSSAGDPAMEQLGFVTGLEREEGGGEEVWRREESTGLEEPN